MKKDYNNYAFWLALFALVISIVALCIFIFKVSPNSIVTVDTYIGVIATFIGISVTMLMGYQIFNVLDTKKTLKEFEELKESFDEQKKHLDYLELEHNEGVNILQARLCSGKDYLKVDAFLKMHEAIQYSLSTDHKKDGYKWMLEELSEYMLGINKLVLLGGGGTDKQCREAVKQFRKLYKDNDSAIRTHENFFYIMDRYDEMMIKFEKRLDLIADFKDVSSEEIDKEWGK